MQDLATAYNVARAEPRRRALQCELRAHRGTGRRHRLRAPRRGRRTRAAGPAGDRARCDRTRAGWCARGSRIATWCGSTTGAAATVAFDAFPGRDFAGTVDARRRRRRSHDRHVRGRGRGANRPARASRADSSPRSTARWRSRGRDACRHGGRRSPRSSRRTARAGHRVRARRGAATSRAARRSRSARCSASRSIVTAGLAVGEPVITDGAAWLTDGRAVRVVTDDQG